MPHFSNERTVRHSADQMFALVADVEAYPEFLPLCESLHVRSRDMENGHDVLVAEMTVAYKLVRERFTTRVTLDPGARTIAVEYLEGPFSHLHNLWRFEPIGADRAKVVFAIDYEFRSKMLGILMGAVFDRAFRRFAEAFEERADKLYGTA